MRIKLTVEHSDPRRVGGLSQGFASITDEQPRGWQDDYVASEDEYSAPANVDKPYYVCSAVFDVPLSTYAQQHLQLSGLDDKNVEFVVKTANWDENVREVASPVPLPLKLTVLMVHRGGIVGSAWRNEYYIATIAYHH